MSRSSRRAHEVMGQDVLSLFVWAVVPSSVGSFQFALTRGHCSQLSRYQTGIISAPRPARQRELGTRTSTSLLPIRRTLQPPLRVARNAGEEDDDETLVLHRAAAMLRELSPRELESVRIRLGIEDEIGGDDFMIQAVAMLASKIRERGGAQREEREIEEAVENKFDERFQNSKDRAGEGRQTERNGGRDDLLLLDDDDDDHDHDANGKRQEPQERLGDRGSGSASPRQRRADKQPDPPLAPGERAYFATCPRGLETVLRDELISPDIGAVAVKTSGRGCHFRGSQAVGYRAILWLRTAHRVLEVVGDSDEILGEAVTSADLLYETASAVDWSRYMRHDQTLSVDAILGVVPDGLTHSHFTALTVKNAVVDQFREQDVARPSVDTDHPDLPLVVYMDRGRVLLYRSLSGTRSMHKRGYRDVMHAASLKENIAAGLLLASNWDPERQSIADPMCGSGTLLIEAALIATRRAPGLMAIGALPSQGQGQVGNTALRSGSTSGWRPAIHSWPDFDYQAWRTVVEEAIATVRPHPPAAIMGNDWHHGALSLAWRDAKAASVEHCIVLSDAHVADWRPPRVTDIAITNPPWERRLDGGVEKSWRDLLEFLRREVAEKDAWVLSGNPVLSRILGMKSERNMFLATGGVELRFLQYHLHEYRGARGAGKTGKRRGPRPRKTSRRFDRPAIDRW